MASPDLLEQNGFPEQPNDLRHHECNFYTHQSELDTWVFDRSDGTEERVRVSGRLHCNNGDAIAELVVEALQRSLPSPVAVPRVVP